jgi:hypothetical protein
VDLKFKNFSISINTDEVGILRKIATESLNTETLAVDDWAVVDLLYKKHIIVYDKSNNRRPEIQPWCRNIVLRTLSNDQSGS